MLWITSAMIERILDPSSSCLPSTSRISVSLTFNSLGLTKCSFSSSEEASEFLFSKEREILKITKLSIIHHWGEILEGDTEDKSWSNENKTLGDHEWKLYSSGRLTEQYYYAYEGDDLAISYGKRSLSPLLAASIIQESEIAPAKDLFESGVKKADSIMKQRQKTRSIWGR